MAESALTSSASGRPGSGTGRPGSASGRPGSGTGRPGSASGQSAPPVAASRVTGSASAAGPVLRALHVLAAVAAWAIFAALWVWQMSDYRPSDFSLYPLAIAAALVALVVFGRAWIEWNRRIYRRRHNRVSALEREVDFVHDSIGRPVRCDPALRYAPGQLIIEIEDGAKVYRPGLRLREVDPLDSPEPGLPEIETALR